MSTQGTTTMNVRPLTSSKRRVHGGRDNTCVLICCSAVAPTRTTLTFRPTKGPSRVCAPSGPSRTVVGLVATPPPQLPYDATSWTASRRPARPASRRFWPTTPQHDAERQARAARNWHRACPSRAMINLVRPSSNGPMTSKPGRSSLPATGYISPVTGQRWPKSAEICAESAKFGPNSLARFHIWPDFTSCDPETAKFGPHRPN